MYLAKIVLKNAQISKSMMKQQDNALIAQKEQLISRKMIHALKYVQEIRPLML